MSFDCGTTACSAASLLLTFCAATLSAAPMPATVPTQAQITVLYDAFGRSSDMHKDWGYAALVGMAHTVVLVALFFKIKKGAGITLRQRSTP